MIMTAKRLTRWRKSMYGVKCLCCDRPVKIGEQFIAVGSIGVQHEKPCPRRRPAKTRPWTRDEIAAPFVAHLRGIAEYWATLPGAHTVRDRIDGAIFSTLVVLGMACTSDGHNHQANRPAGRPPTATFVGYQCSPRWP